MEESRKYLIIIAGPTAIGKTDLAIKVAKEFETEIISADARQLYKEMNIGTAKPDAQQLAAVKHHFIDTLSIDESYNAGKFETDALKVLEELYETKDVVVMAGGSGLYINAVRFGIDEMPDIDPEIRNAIKEDFAKHGIAYLQEELLRSDPEYHAKVDLANPSRLMRALEVFRATGIPYSNFLNKEKKPRPFEEIYIGLNTDRKQLYKRINQRVDTMIQDGLEEEVRSLMSHEGTNAMQTVGYREWFEYLDGKDTKESVIEAIKQHTRNYAKRQLTWFNRDEKIKWFFPFEKDAILDYISERRNG
ncbi:MAG: tRNA (adenosine(37)-N6)-dimethylallyltransferase MiaA [Bacteroidota bacterium]